jgi:hypothetical protein
MYNISCILHDHVVMNCLPSKGSRRGGDTPLLPAVRFRSRAGFQEANFDSVDLPALAVNCPAPLHITQHTRELWPATWHASGLTGSWPLEPSKHRANPTRQGLDLASAMRLRAPAAAWDELYQPQMHVHALQDLRPC